jgi:hypothetical protein
LFGRSACCSEKYGRTASSRSDTQVRMPRWRASCARAAGFVVAPRCSDVVWTLMDRCWRTELGKRPSFDKLKISFGFVFNAFYVPGAAEAEAAAKAKASAESSAEELQKLREENKRIAKALQRLMEQNDRIRAGNEPAQDGSGGEAAVAAAVASHAPCSLRWACVPIVPCSHRHYWRILAVRPPKTRSVPFVLCGWLRRRGARSQHPQKGTARPSTNMQERARPSASHASCDIVPVFPPRLHWAGTRSCICIACIVGRVFSSPSFDRNALVHLHRMHCASSCLCISLVFIGQEHARPAASHALCDIVPVVPLISS